MGRPAKISRDQLQQAALALVDRRGLSGLSMRALAATLGTGPMTLYNHVAHREDLELLVIDAVLTQANWAPEPQADWREVVRSIATAIWTAVRAHPHVIPLIVTRRSRSPALLDMSEALLAALAHSGRSHGELLIALRSVTALVMGFAQVELTSPLSRAAGERPQSVIRRMRALPRERYPRLIEVATAAMTSQAETEFRAGLDALIAGLTVPTAIESAVPTRSKRQRRSPRSR